MAWTDILGHEDAKRLLQTHLRAEAVASAYLFAGPDGVGKRRLALEMAKALNCSGDGAKPCDACSTCSRITRGVHPDVHVLSPGGASDQIKIEEIRHLLGRIALRPFSAAMQAAIIDGADRLTEEAANSLLKALEEPPAHTRFLLTTSRLSFCLPTIVSRCQLVRCGPLPVDAVKRLLIAQGRCDAAMAEAVAPLAAGGVAFAADLAGRWAEHQRLRGRLADPSPSAWLEQPLPETREGVAHLLEGMMAWLRDAAVASAADSSRVADLDRCVQTAMELFALRESLDQFVSPRLVASLAREKWLGLIPEVPGHFSFSQGPR